MMPANSVFKKRDWVLGLLLLGTALVIYQPALNGQPLWDDEINITVPELRSLAGLGRIWIHPGATLQYFPLTHTLFWLEYRLWGTTPLGYHLLNVFLHVVCALLLVKVLRRLDVRGAWLAGAVFALHPVMVESVAWITQLKNTLSGVFFFAAALTYLTYVEGRRRHWYFLSLGAFLLGLLSKTSIVPFPLAILVAIWCKQRAISLKRDVVPLLPFVVVGILLGLTTIHMEHAFGGANNREFAFSFVERGLIAGRVVWFYLGKLLVPVNQAFIYPRWHVSSRIGWQYLYPIAALLFGVVLWALRRRWRAPLAAYLYFVVMLVPTAGFFNVYAFRYSFVADHWQYLAAIGPITLVAGMIDRGLASVAKHQNLKTAVSGMFLLTLAVLSHRQSQTYFDAETLFEETISRNDACWLAHNNLAVLLVSANKTDEAIEHYQKALEINPNYAKAHFNLGNVLAGTGRGNEALVHYEKAVQLDPGYVNARIRLGSVLLHAGRIDEGIAQYLKVVQINPNDDRAHASLGDIFMQTGKLDQAAAHYSRAAEINPKAVAGPRGLGNVMLKSGKLDDAIAYFKKALEVAPSDIDTYLSLALATGQKGRFTAAIEVLESAVPYIKSPLDDRRIRVTALAIAERRDGADSPKVDLAASGQP